MAPQTADITEQFAKACVRQDPQLAARILKSERPESIVQSISGITPAETVAILQQLPAPLAAQVLVTIEASAKLPVMKSMEPTALAYLLTQLDKETSEQTLSTLEPSHSEELRLLMNYPLNTAGAMMDPRYMTFSKSLVVKDVMKKLSKFRKGRILDVVVTEDDRTLLGLVPLQKLLLAEPTMKLEALVPTSTPSVNALSQRDEVVEMLNRIQITTLPVVDIEQRVLGAIRNDELMHAVQEEAFADIQTMVGVGKEERALSSPWLSVKKRLPWLNINLLTAFVAAAVVGMFENVIAQVTALAVLLPVVAGQSGNTGAQALAVTMRGLALREVRVSQWPRLLIKESLAGAMNGIAIAIVTGIGVYIWSGSLGISLVIFASMIIAMIIAGASGAAIPVILTKLGQDPAQSSSIILTTVTDVFGFLSFLGLATIFAQFL